VATSRRVSERDPPTRLMILSACSIKVDAATAFPMAVVVDLGDFQLITGDAALNKQPSVNGAEFMLHYFNEFLRLAFVFTAPDENFNRPCHLHIAPSAIQFLCPHENIFREF
jgi:hypothetical protein